MGPSELLHCSSQAKQVTLHTESGNLSDRSSCDVRVLAEFFSFIDVGNMHFDGGNPGRCECVPNSHTGMGIRSRIDDDSTKLPRRFLNPTYQLSFAVRLSNIDSHPQLFCERMYFLVNLIQGEPAIDFRLTLAQ